jgi:uncharacterized surface protein with fasciclin (FAS1) repeats
MKNRLFAFLFLFLPISGGLLLLNACDPEGQLPSTNEKNLIATVSENPELSTFLAALNRSGLSDTLTNYSPFTLFAPTNEAFAASRINVELIPMDSLEEVMLYHILSGRYLTEFFGSDSVQTLLDVQYLNFRTGGGRITVNGEGTLIRGDIEAINGMIHVVDRVLIPE